MRYERSGSAFVLKACQMSFNGTKNNDIAKALGVHPADVSRWRKLPLWKEFHQELLDVQRKALLDAQVEKGVKAESLAQG